LGEETKFKRFGVETKFKRFGVETKFNKLGVETSPTKEAEETYPADPNPLTVDCKFWNVNPPPVPAINAPFNNKVPLLTAK